MHVPNQRCEAMLHQRRCAKSANHPGWHADGLLEWFDPEQARTRPPCDSINVHDNTYICTEPQGHKGAHRAGGLMWTDPRGNQ